ncbi:MAG: hypothetical protein V1847_04130 [Candidatus Diapherotrites archaeon]
MVKLAPREQFSDLREVGDLEQARELMRKGFQVVEAEHGKYLMGKPKREMQKVEKELEELEEEREILGYEERLLEGRDAQKRVVKDIEWGVLAIFGGAVIVGVWLAGILSLLGSEAETAVLFVGIVCIVWGLHDFFQAREER